MKIKLEFNQMELGIFDKIANFAYVTRLYQNKKITETKMLREICYRL